MPKQGISILLILSCFVCFDAGTLNAADTASAKQTKNNTISLAEVAPELYYQLRRYPKFYGGPNTEQGGLLERTQLLGNFGGVRETLVDHGIYLDVDVTQFLQGNTTGGRDDGSARYNGTADYFLTFDSGKAGLWSGGALFLHAESSWQAASSVNPDAGSLLPANWDAAMPTPGDSKSIALPEFYLVQALPANFMVVAGKVNWAGLADNNLFANNERTQFGFAGLVNNPILGVFVPYTSIGLGGVWAAPSKKHTVALIAIQRDGNATTNGFDNFNGDYTYGGQYQFSPKLGGKLPGDYRALVGYTNKDVRSFDIDPRNLIGGIIGIVPIAKKSHNQTFVINFDQYLWVKDGGPVAGRKGLPPVGIGVFGRAGWAPKDRNVIDQFYSLGVGGYGMLIPGRDHDQWGIGWAGTHVSSDLRDNLEVLRRDIDNYGHAFEAYYNIELTPAMHLTVNTQVINSPSRTIDNAVTLGGRLQVDF